MELAIDTLNNVNQGVGEEAFASANTLMPHSKTAAEMQGLHYGCSTSPFGQMWIAWTTDSGDECIHRLVFESEDKESPAPTWNGRHHTGSAQRDDLGAAKLARTLFTREKTSPRHLRVEGTPFQCEVWQALLDIPFGAVVTYSDIAQAIGRPKAVRAVASAIGANPIAWLIPCHRVVRSDGGLGGYRWGIDCKQAMLDWEADRAVSV